MNYIRKLQEENKNLKEKISQVQNEINLFIGFLHSEKFAGFDSTGERKDWISTGDTINRLMEIRSTLN